MAALRAAAAAVPITSWLSTGPTLLPKPRSRQSSQLAALHTNKAPYKAPKSKQHATTRAAVSVESPPSHVDHSRVFTVEEEASPDTSSAHKQAVAIYDTTLRDGAQMVGISLTVADKLKIAQALSALGVAYIEGGWPGSNPKDAEFFRRWQERGHEGPRLAAFGSTRRKNTTCMEDPQVQALIDSKAPVITLVAKAWDAQVIRVLGTTLKENLAMVTETVQHCCSHGREVMLDAEHFFDGYKANPHYAMEVMRVAAEAGASTLVLCDTNGGSMPWEVEDAVRAVCGSLPHVRVGIHTHNDCGLAVATSIAAVRGGASLVQGCVNGYGERTGNANIISVIGILQLKMGYFCVPDETMPRLLELSSEVALIAGVGGVPANQPFVGSSAFAHKGGLHVAALRKMPESYNHIDPALVGNRMKSVVSELSGRGNVLDRAEAAGLELSQGAAGNGCAFEHAGASVEMIIVRRGPDYKRPFTVLEYSVISSNRGSEGIGDECDHHDSHNICVNQAIVKLDIPGVTTQQPMSAAEGNGPVDALSTALRSALQVVYPQLQRVALKDYTVRLLESDGSGATTRVTIDFADESGSTWSTVGAHTSIVEASFRALMDGLEFGIINCSSEGCTVPYR
eukprot:jgi/Chlat1/4206/Chrsp27S04242